MVCHYSMQMFKFELDNISIYVLIKRIIVLLMVHKLQLITKIYEFQKNNTIISI